MGKIAMGNRVVTNELIVGKKRESNKKLCLC